MALLTRQTLAPPVHAIAAGGDNAALIAKPGGTVSRIGPSNALDASQQDAAMKLIDVDTAGLGGWDVLGAYRPGDRVPCVIRGEGVGSAPEGRRV